MEAIAGDLFATKAIEYPLVIAYLAMLVGCWKLVFPNPKKPHDAHMHHGPMPEGYYFHQGHSWVHPIDQDVVRAGIDDFAQQAIGHPGELVMPTKGTVLEAGEPAWEVQLGNGAYFAMLSPVSGIIVAVNDDVLHSPGLVNSQPYGEGWLVDVQVDSDAYRSNLLSGELAEHWMKLAYKVAPGNALDQLLASTHLSETT